MKNTLKALLLSAALIGGAMTAAADEKDKATPNVERYNVTTDDGLLAFGKSYYERDGRPVGANGNYYSPDHTNWSIKNWPKSGGSADATQHLATYLHFPACQSNAQIQLTTTGPVTFKIKVTCCEDNSVISEKTVSFGAGAQQWISVMDKESMPQSAWYKFDIECTAGAANVGEFFYWKFDQKTAGTDRVYTADYMSSPSVHLNGWKTTDPKAPAAGRYDWVYQEVMIPEGDDIVGTYAMSLGILHGYMGIQKDSENDYPIIFSMWDNGNTDTDKNLPAYLRSGALDNEDGVTIARFGGEGTGAQAKRRTGQNWLPGHWVKFVANCRPEVVDVEIDDPDNPGQKKTITYTNTLCTAWYMAEGIDNDWQYLATIRQSGANNYFDGWYSFLEDYNWPSGQWARRSYYRNGGLHSMVDGKWYHANEVSFGHTDGGTHYGDRNDYGHGVAKEYDNCFYLYSGGYKESVNDTERTLPLKQNIMPLDEATIQRLTARVDQAIKKEQTLKIAEQFETSREQLSATGFTVVGNNSEATNEGETNRATAATDGNENTYWHTRWSQGTGAGGNGWPYTLDIEVSEDLQAKAIEQIAFYQGRGDNYRAKSVEVLVSADKSNWSSLGSYDLANEARPTFNLTSSITGKHYIRLNFTAGYGSFLYLNEVYFRTAVSTDALNEQVQEMLARENQFDGYSTADLAPLKTAYNSGNWTDAQAIKTAMQKVAAEGTILKFGVANSTAALSSFKSYQIHNLYNMGDVIVRNGAPAVADCGSFSVVDEANNWLILRSEKWNAYYLYNVAAKKYLAYDGGVKLVSEPTPLSITYSDGAFHFNLDASITAGFLSADNHAATVAQVGAAGAAWELRDNYGLTPDATLVRSLLADIEKNGLPSFDGNGYAIRLEGVDPAVYLSTAEVKDNNTTTYSLSSYPEYFKVERNGSGYTITSAHTGKSLGYTNTTSWDVSNRPDVWYFTLGTEPTTIRKAASGNDVALGPEAEANKRTAGYGVFTNKDNANTWVFELYNGEITEPDPEPEVQYFTYKIRSKQRGTYAYINSAAVKEGVTILGLDNNATTFTFEGTFEDGYKMSATTASGKQYVYAVDGGQDANSNVGLTTDAEAATVWQFKYVNSNGGRDNYNIVPKDKGLSWNVRGTVGGVSTIGHWYSGNYDGSLWQVEAVSNENISITYNFQGESFGPVSETYTLPKGSFFPKTLPYGVTAETPTGVATESSTRTVPYTVAENYPLALVADAEDLSAFYNLKIKQGDKHVGINEDGTFNVAADAEPELFAFVGTPWGIKIYSYSAAAFVGGTAADNQNVTAAFPQDEAAVYLLEKNANGYAFRVKGTTNGYLNNYGGMQSSRLGYWFHNSAQGDGGSTFIITEVEDPELSFYTIGTLVNLIEWAKEGFIELQQIEEAVDAILRRKK